MGTVSSVGEEEEGDRRLQGSKIWLPFALLVFVLLVCYAILLSEGEDPDFVICKG